MRLICALLTNKRGSVGLLSIIAMVLLGVVGAAYIALSSTEVSSSASYRNGVAAQFLAEAGARRAIVELEKDRTWEKTQTPVKMGSGVTEGTYDVLVKGAVSGDDRTVISKGVVGNATRKIVLKLKLGSSEDNVYSYSIFSGTNMNVDNNGEVYGSIRSNALINLNNNAYVSKDVMAHSGVNQGNNSTVGGQVTTNAPRLDDIPSYNASDYSGGYPISSVGNNAELNLDKDRYYRDGDLVISNNATIIGDCTIYVTGNVILENNVSLTGEFMIIARGDINVGNGVTINKGVLYSEHNINLENNSRVTGSAVAKGTVNIHNNAKITYNQSVIQNFGLGGSGQLTITSWGNTE